MAAYENPDEKYDWSLWKTTEEATLLFAFDGAGRVLLIHKKRGLGKGKINAPGGRLEPGESALEAAVRETREEVGLDVKNAVFRGRLFFHFVDGYNLLGHVFSATEWSGAPVETDEALPEWFALGGIPYARMWADDALWLPLMLAGENFVGKFVFDDDIMLENDVAVVGRQENDAPCR